MKKKIEKKNTLFRCVCCEEGLYKRDKRDYLTTNHWAKTRTNCSIRITFMYIKDIEKHRVKGFVPEHNHTLNHVETTHMLAYQRQVSQV